MLTSCMVEPKPPVLWKVTGVIIAMEITQEFDSKLFLLTKTFINKSRLKAY